jgi:diacylglycerol kinase (ATP)
MKFNFTLSRLKSFRNAFIGWWHVIRTQQNAWIHALATVVVILVATWLKLPTRDWAVLILTIAMVWTAEFLNTALEIVVDLASPDLHPLAKVGKDVGAASVLIAAGSAVIVGVLIMGPLLWAKIAFVINLLGIL